MHNGEPYHRSKVVSKYLWKSKVKVLDTRKQPKLEPSQKLVSHMNYHRVLKNL